MPLARQHLIDPDICIRCNTCEEICPSQAITHDDLNYVVDFDKCDSNFSCLPPCPTGAIDSFRMVAQPFSIEDQFEWDDLPDDQGANDDESGRLKIPEDVARITAIATEGLGGRSTPPWSAAHPYVNIYTPDRPAIGTIAGNLRLTDPDADVDIHHIVVDMGKTAFPFLEGQSIGILPPGHDDAGKPHHVRLYSVASAREGERPGYNNLALSIKRIEQDQDGNRVHGVASNFLCDLKRGAEIKITGPFGDSFLMPNEPDARIVMICTGTGSAPFRAMTERRRRRASIYRNGTLHLFFGARRRSELPYFGPLMKLPKDLIDVELAFSREEDAPKEYVQDRLRARADDLAALIQDDNSYFFICGHKRMEQGVHDALADICAAHQLEWAHIFPDLRDAGRFHVETYF